MRAVKASVTDTHILVELEDGQTLMVDFMKFPRLANADPDHRAALELNRNGTGLHWSYLDEDISVSALVKEALVDPVQILSKSLGVGLQRYAKRLKAEELLDETIGKFVAKLGPALRIVPNQEWSDGVRRMLADHTFMFYSRHSSEIELRVRGQISGVVAKVKFDKEGAWPLCLEYQGVTAYVHDVIALERVLCDITASTRFGELVHNATI